MYNSVPKMFVLCVCVFLEGNMHRYGQGVEENVEQAVEYYQKGCELGQYYDCISRAC